MSTRAKLAGWVAAFVVLGGWSWHLAAWSGFQLLTIGACFGGVAWLAVRSLLSVDSQRGLDDVERAADPRRYNGERP